MPNSHYALIMAGGEGTRFVPLSTPERPKQFLHLLDPQKSLLQQTYDRLLPSFGPQNILVGTNQRYVALVQEQLSNIPAQNIFGETHKKNTAPCIAWVSHQLWKKDENAVIAALPADHFITPSTAFSADMKRGLNLAETQKKIILIGIQPTHPSTQYGYIHAKTATFVEKPDTETAKRYINDGNYLWNSGMFIFPAKTMLQLLEKYQPEIFALLQTSSSLGDFFAKAPSISIDYGVMEKTKELVCIPATFEWSDVGTWENLAHLAKRYDLNLGPEVTKHFPQT